MVAPIYLGSVLCHQRRVPESSIGRLPATSSWSSGTKKHCLPCWISWTKRAPRATLLERWPVSARRSAPACRRHQLVRSVGYARWLASNYRATPSGPKRPLARRIGAGPNRAATLSLGESFDVRRVTCMARVTTRQCRSMNFPAAPRGGGTSPAYRQCLGMDVNAAGGRADPDTARIGIVMSVRGGALRHVLEISHLPLPERRTRRSRDVGNIGLPSFASPDERLEPPKNARRSREQQPVKHGYSRKPHRAAASRRNNRRTSCLLHPAS